MKDDLKPVSRQDLRFDIEMALLKARSLWPSRRARSRDNPYGAMANAVVEHLARCGIRFFRIPPREAHGTPHRPYMRAEGGEDSGTLED